MSNKVYLGIIQKSRYKNGKFDSNRVLYLDVRDSYDNFEIKVKDVIGLLEVLGNENIYDFERARDILQIFNDLVSKLSTTDASVFDKIMSQCIKNKTPLYFDDNCIPMDIIKSTFYRFIK